MDKLDEKSGSDRRRFERTAVLWSGHLVCGGQEIDCVIVNVSPVGALVRVEDPGACKDNTVVLHSPRFGELSGEVTRRCDNELGVEFSDSEQVISEKIDQALS